MEKEKIKQLADSIMLNLTDEEIEQIDHEFDGIEIAMQTLDAINTDGVEPMVYPFEQATSFLREDEVDKVLSQKEALKNAPKVVNGQVVVPKVVK